MKYSKKLLILLPLIGVLASCGYDLKETYQNDEFKSPIFKENYYSNYADKIDPNSKNYSVDESKTVSIELNDSNKVFTKYEQAKNLGIDKDMETLKYTEDLKTQDLVDIGYGPTKNLSRIDSTFNYGLSSKLFDGQIFCNGGFENVRIQTAEKGWGFLFDKELDTYSYFAVNFKGAAWLDGDNRGTYLKQHTCDINIHVSFYLKDGNKFNKVVCSYPITSVPTNPAESYGNYTFFGFSLENINIKRCAGFSISYDIIKDEEYEKADPDKRYHALWIYEALIPNSTWR